jgi:hypothetical protein
MARRASIGLLLTQMLVCSVESPAVAQLGVAFDPEMERELVDGMKSNSPHD